MAEDAVKLCKRGHPRAPENVTPARNCKECERLRSKGRDRHPYNASERGRERARAYGASYKGWATQRRYELKGAREAITKKLSALNREERRCLQTLSECQTQTRSS